MTARGSQDDPVAAGACRETLYAVSTSKQPLRLVEEFAERAPEAHLRRWWYEDSDGSWNCSMKGLRDRRSTVSEIGFAAGNLL